MEDGFKDMVAEWWDSNVVTGWSGFVLMHKMRGLRGRIREWCRAQGAWDLFVQWSWRGKCMI